VKDSEKCPVEKLALPTTANMEYGFFTQPLSTTNPMVRASARQCFFFGHFWPLLTLNPNPKKKPY